MKSKPTNIFSKIKETIEKLDITSISTERKAKLDLFVDFLKEELKSKDAEINLTFICTHNSRRSHFSQIWAQAIASYFGLNNVNCYSGGTESTAIYKSVIETLQNSGFEINRLCNKDNAFWSIRFNETSPTVVGFSKEFSNPFNPQKNFAAVMTCSEADANCPFVPGTKKRISFTFEDPKFSDGTKDETIEYEKTSNEIATELLYVFSSALK